LERGVERRLIRLATADRVQELVVLDRDQVFEADRVAAAGDEVAVVREAVSAEDGRVAVGREVEPQLVEALEIPRERALRPVDVERHLALGADERPSRLERRAGTARELGQQ